MMKSTSGTCTNNPEIMATANGCCIATCLRRWGLGWLASLCVALPTRASQPLETETARLPEAGALEFESTVECQTSSDGQELAIPLALTYGITDRLEFLVEPVLYTRIMPDQGSTETGIGDVETTLTWRLNNETERYWETRQEPSFPTSMAAPRRSSTGLLPSGTSLPRS